MTNKLHTYLCISVQFFFATFFIQLLYYKDGIYPFKEKDASPFPSLDTFMQDWCRVKSERFDLNSKLRVCNHSFSSWENSYTDEQKRNLATDTSKSEISKFIIKPSGEFSRFFITTKTAAGVPKTVGGDSWRIRLLGPSSISPTVFDLSDGTYEVLFLVLEPGVYKVNITLDYSLCDGYRDPPHNWFIIGNSQGKMQPNGCLQGHAKSDYLMKRFKDGKPIMINIPLSRGKGAFLLNAIPDLHASLLSKYDVTCGMKCKWMWDGSGRWIDDEWKPYLSPRNRKAVGFQSTTPKYSTLLVYGDSQADRMFRSLQKSPLCNEIFASCKVRKMWVYPYTKELPPNDDLDFNHDVIIRDLKTHLEQPEMDENSVMLLNMGLHYLMDVNVTTFVKLVDSVVKMISDGQASKRIRAKVIWKTTTAISKEKDLGEFLFADRKRFLNGPRIELFNPITTKRMCAAGLEVFDVYPLTRGYPAGTGGPDVEFYKEHDIVHFKFYLLKPLEKVLEKYLRGQVPLPINMENYEFH